MKELPSLVGLNLMDNRLSELPARLFDRLPALKNLADC